MIQCATGCNRRLSGHPMTRTSTADPAGATSGNITMAEIARRCRLSKATVSRALSLPAADCPLNPKTRERVIRLAAGLGYRPNWRARAFSMQQTRTVGLITAGLLPQHEAIPHQILEA